MRTHNKLLLSILAACAAPYVAAAEQTPAWQEPGFVMEEIVVTLPRTRVEPAEHDYVAEIVVTLSLEEQAKILRARADAVEIAAHQLDTPIRL